MFLRILFKKHGIKENKWIMAGFYAAAYFLIFFLLVTGIGMYLGRVNTTRNLILSVFMAVGMYAVYIFKWELFYSKIKL